MNETEYIFTEKEYEMIYNYIKDMSYEINIIFNRNQRLLSIKELLEWLNQNGGCVLTNQVIKKLKTKDKLINTYIAKWGIKFQVIMDLKYNAVSDVQIKLLTKH